jgi:hypothetical protein
MLDDIQVKKLITPVAYHIAHSKNWNWEHWGNLAYRMAKHMGLPKYVKKQMLGYLAQYIVLLIEENSQKISLSDD